MKHTLKIKDLFNKKEQYGLLILLVGALILGGYLTLYSFFSGVFLILIGIGVPSFLFIKRSKKRFVRVIRISDKDEIARFNFEFWEIEDIKVLDRKYFWKYRNKLIVVGWDRADGFTPVYPFNRPLPAVTSGHMKRTLVQDSTDDLMTPEKTTLKEAVVLGGVFLICGLLAVLNFAMFNNMLEKL